MRRSSHGSWLGLLALGCGAPAGSETGPGATTGMQTETSVAMPTSTATSETPTGGVSSETGETGGAGEGPCAPDVLQGPAAEVTYYVAMNEPGASNEGCDGLAPTDEGGGRCPFKDLSSPAVLGLLDGVKSTRVELRAGTYVVTGWDGLRVTGIGTSEAERVVLSAYMGEEAVLDVASPGGEECMGADAPDVPTCVRQVVRVSGQYTVVQGLVIRNGLGYNLEVTGGAHHLVRCNHLTETVEFAPRSDSLKLDGGASDVEVSNNEFDNWRSQAIDVTGVHDIDIKNNEFHDPHDADGGAVGCKYGAADVTIGGNRVHDLGSDPQGHVFSLGGTGSPHPDDREAYRIRVVDNVVTRVAGKLAQVVSCEDCSIEGNDVSELGAGVLVSAAATGLPECEVNGCGATTGLRIAGNRSRGLDGGGDPASANIFVYIEDGEAEGLVAEDNLYCAPAADAHRFGWQGALIGFAAWVAATGTDAGSQALVDGDAACAGW